MMKQKSVHLGGKLTPSPFLHPLTATVIGRIPSTAGVTSSFSVTLTPSLRY